MESLIPHYLVLQMWKQAIYIKSHTNKEKQDEITEWRLFRAKEGTVSL